MNYGKTSKLNGINLSITLRDYYHNRIKFMYFYYGTMTGNKFPRQFFSVSSLLNILKLRLNSMWDFCSDGVWWFWFVRRFDFANFENFIRCFLVTITHVSKLTAVSQNFGTFIMEKLTFHHVI